MILAHNSQLKKYKARKNFLAKKYHTSIVGFMLLIIFLNWTWQYVRKSNLVFYRHRLEGKGGGTAVNLSTYPRVVYTNEMNYPNKVCAKGFVHNNETCLDFDECIKNSSSKLSEGYIACGHGAFCSNKVGGFACLCRNGFKTETGIPEKSETISAH